jgi:hypothetical protein
MLISLFHVLSPQKNQQLCIRNLDEIPRDHANISLQVATRTSLICYRQLPATRHGQWPALVHAQTKE